MELNRGRKLNKNHELPSHGIVFYNAQDTFLYPSETNESINVFINAKIIQEKINSYQ